MQGNSGFKMSVDTRRNSSPKEGMTTCRGCGCTIVALPNDRRRGFCYDCYDPLEGDEQIRIPSTLRSRPSGK
jgi:RNase P subunit RPR2